MKKIRYRLEYYVFDFGWISINRSDDICALLSLCKYLKKLNPKTHFRVIKVIEIN